MKRSEVEVGKVYTAKISGKLVPVLIERDRGTRRSWLNTSRAERHDGWDAENVKTGRQIIIATAARLRGEYKPHRCGVCANCNLMLSERETIGYRHLAARGTEKADVILADWKARCEQLPCLKPGVSA